MTPEQHTWYWKGFNDAKQSTKCVEQDYPFGVYGAEDLDRAWKSGYDNCKAQSAWTLEDVKKAWKSGYAAAIEAKLREKNSL